MRIRFTALLPSRCRAGASLITALLLPAAVVTAARPSLRSPAVRPAGTIGKLAFRDLGGRRYSDHDLFTAKGTLFLFLSTECPISNAYTGRILRLAHDYQPRGLGIFGVNPNDSEAVAVVARDARERGFPFPIVKDAGAALARKLGARITPEAVLLDPHGVVRYRGRIDDNRDAPRVQSRDLAAAIDAMLAGQPVPVAQTRAFGCVIQAGQAVSRPAGGKQPAGNLAAVTYARDVAPILQKGCQGCHRPGEIGPFPLMTYAQARRWAGAIKDYTSRRIMPPWKPEPGETEYANTRALTAKEIAVLGRWADAGAPLGNPKELPAPRKFAEGWTMGKPDLILEPTEDFHLDAEGPDAHQCFVLPTRFPDVRYIAAVEVRPGNRTVVHHVSVQLDIAGRSEALDAAEPGPGYKSFGGIGVQSDGMLAGWLPGNAPWTAPQGVASELPPGACIVMQIHYHKSGKPETDRTRLGIYFAHGPVDKKLRIAKVRSKSIDIPAGATRHEVHAEWVVPADITVLSVIPHMHLLGREIRLVATLPDGTKKPMVWIKDWDFNWQESYVFKEPLALPEATRLELTAYYDNSDQNPNNPNRPPREVTWGEQTTDEMCTALLRYTLDCEHLTADPSRTPDAGPPANIAGAWTLNAAEMPGVFGPVTVTFQQQGTQLTGTFDAGEVVGTLTGTVSGEHLAFRVEAGNGVRSMRIGFNGRAARDTLSGFWEIGTKALGKWSGTRPPQGGGARPYSSLNGTGSSSRRATGVSPQ